MPYTPLHVHTEHSSLDGLARLKDTAQAAADHGFEACALTDHGTPGGLWTFAQECKKRGVKPIAGCEVYMAIGSRHDPETMNVYADDGMGDADDEITTDGTRRVKKKSYYHLTVLARNRTGWHNLMRFHNESQQTKIGKHPAGDWQLLKQYGEGLVVLTGCLASPVAGPLAQIQFCDDPDGEDAQALRADAHTAVDHMIAAVGAQHVFVEVMDHGIGSEHYVIDELQALAQQRGLDVVATNDSHYLHCDDDRAHEAFLAVGTGSSVRDGSRFKFNGSGYHFATEGQMRDIRADDEDWQNAVTATGLVADLVEGDTVPEPEIRLPKFGLPAGWGSSDAYLRHLVEDGAGWRYGEDWQDDDEVVERIDHELSVVADMGYSDYFLITWDIIEYARGERITVGAGRGSAAGSILAYALGITGLCPLRYDLLFERFLERGRVGLPDIDMDFPKHQRHLIHAYCQRRYGADHVAHIGGFNKAQTKAAIKDAARVMTPVLDKTATGRQRDDQELERKEVFKLGDRLAKIIEHGDNSSQPFARLDDPAEEEERLRAEEFWSAVEDGGDTAAEIIELARRFEGVSKNETIHPCGFVISSEPLFDLVPLRPVSKDAGEDEPQVIVWDGDMVEDFGLLKMDFLGIQNLDYIDLTFEYLARRAEEGLPQSVDDIPDPDGDLDGHFGEDVDAAYDMLAAGRTAGVFQLDGAGMTRVVQDIGPENLNDLSAAVALYRPGPISAKMPEDYAAKKHGRQPESYERLTTDEDEIEWLADVLDETYQSVVYQEQGMRLGQVVAGFDDIQRSTLRKAIGKKKQDLMDQCSEWWFDGYDKEFEKNGELISPVFSRQTAERVWGFIKGSADYSFNKCLTGETKLSTERREDYWTIEKLYRRLHGDWSGPADKCSYCWERPAKPQTPDSPCDRCSSWLTKFKDSSRGFRLLAADSTDGRIRPQMVKDVHHNGVREVYKITLADGRTVRATQNHRFLSADGSYIHVRDLTPIESSLATHGGYAGQEHGSNENRTTSGPRIFKKNVPWYAPKSRNTAFIDGGYVKLREWTLQTWRGAACDECGIPRGETRLERAHLDGNRRNNEPENLAWKCVSHHKKWDYAKNGRRRRWEKGHLVTEAATVVAVEPDGVEDVYDVEMASGTDHNFLANGVVSHNSHSAAYALLAYWTAYLKANYPVEYGAAMLATSDNDEKRLMLLADLKGEGIEIGAPAVNESAQKTVPVSGEIRLGLGEIKDVGKAAASIVDARATGGEFAGLQDFATRVKGINVKSMRALIESGAMDAFGPRRGLLKTLYAAKKADVAPIGDDFGVVERDRRQRAVLGTVVGSTTLDHIDLAEVGQSLGVEDEDQSLSVERLGDLRPESRSACHLGVLSEFRSLISKSGRMSKLAIEDTTATPVVVFPQAHRQMMTEFGEPAVGDLVVVAGKVQTSTYASADEAESHQEILANRVWVIDDPTVVHDQPVETSDLVDALEDAHQGMNQETGPAVEEEPAPNAAHQSDNGVHSEDVDSEYDVGEDDGDDSAAAGPQTWMLALVNESLPDGFSPVARGVLYLQGAPREVTGVVVSATEPVYVDRRSGVAVKFVETDDWEGELSQLRAAAGV